MNFVHSVCYVIMSKSTSRHFENAQNNELMPRFWVLKLKLTRGFPVAAVFCVRLRLTAANVNNTIEL